MNYRELGKTGLSVSEIGFGAWGIGGVVEGRASYGHTTDHESLLAIEKSLELGVNFFDTAPAYGNGKSESLLGQALSSCRSKVIIATKFGVERFCDGQNFSANTIQDSIHKSLQRLQTDYIDLLQLHSPVLAQINLDDVLQVLQQLKEQGKICHIGVSVKSPADIQQLLDITEIDSVQVNFNILDQRILHQGLLQKMVSQGLGVIVRTPLCFGFLTEAMHESVTFPPEDHRSAWSKQQIALWLKGREIVKKEISLVEQETVEMTALRFCLSFGEISCVIPGILTPQHAVQNFQASSRGALNARAISFLKHLYETDKFFV